MAVEPQIWTSSCQQYWFRCLSYLCWASLRSSSIVNDIAGVNWRRWSIFRKWCVFYFVFFLFVCFFCLLVFVCFCLLVCFWSLVVRLVGWLVIGLISFVGWLFVSLLFVCFFFGCDGSHLLLWLVDGHRASKKWRRWACGEARRIDEQTMATSHPTQQKRTWHKWSQKGKAAFLMRMPPWSTRYLVNKCPVVLRLFFPLFFSCFSYAVMVRIGAAWIPVAQLWVRCPFGKPADWRRCRHRFQGHTAWAVADCAT